MVQPKPLRALNGQVCEICGDEIGLTVDGDLFVACNECGFPVCRPCYEYERREGTQLCPQCKTRYKRLKGQLFSESSTLIKNSSRSDLMEVRDILFSLAINCIDEDQIMQSERTQKSIS